MTVNSNRISLTPVAVCPNSCAVDSDCSGCGPDFVCENGQCVKQIPSSINSPLSATMKSKVQYTTTVCYYTLITAVHKCIVSNFGDGLFPGADYAYFTVTVTDQSGRGIPGLNVAISVTLSNPDSTGVTYKVTGANGTITNGTTGVTDHNGNIHISVQATAMPVGWQNIQDSVYPPTVAFQQNNPVGSANVPYGNMSFTLEGTNIETKTDLLDEVSYHGYVHESGGCPCA